MKVIIIPGNGGATPNDIYYPYLERELKKIGIEVINKQYPDPVLARMEFWLPFIESLGADEDTVLIGHSSGALAAMRYAENHKILGSVLISACYTDLDYEDEKQSHYYDEPWQWDKIKNNQKWIIQFASTDDPYIPIEEPRHVHESLGTEYYEYTDRGHFGWDVKRTEFPEIVDALIKKMGHK